MGARTVGQAGGVYNATYTRGNQSAHHDVANSTDHIRPVLEDVRPSDVTSHPAAVRPTTPPQAAVNVTLAANTTTTSTQSSLHSRTSLTPPISTTTTTTTISPATLLQPPATLGTETPPAHDDSAKPAILNTTFAAQKTTKISTSTSTLPPPLTTTTSSISTTTTGSTTTTTIPTPPTTSLKHPLPPATTPAIRTQPPQILHVNETFISNSSFANDTNADNSTLLLSDLTTNPWPLSTVLIWISIPLVLVLIILLIAMVIFACCRRPQATGRGSRVRYRRADKNRNDSKQKSNEPELPMMYALISLGQRAQMSRWIDPEETMTLTQVNPGRDGTRETNEDLTLTSFGTGRTELPVDGFETAGTAKWQGDCLELHLDNYETAGTAKWQGDCLDVRERAIVPETVMVENDLYEIPAADECNDGPEPGPSNSIDSNTSPVQGTSNGIDSDSSPDRQAIGQSSAVNDDVICISGDVSLSGEGQMSDEDWIATMTPEDPSHDYDVVYMPRSDAAAMVRRVDSTGYVKSKLQRNHAYEEVRMDRQPPCVSTSPTLPPRRTPGTSPALPHRRTPVASPALPRRGTPATSPAMPHRRTPAPSPALPPRRVPQGMFPAFDYADCPASPPLPPRGSSRLPTTERTTPLPSRRSTSVPSSPVAQHPSPPPIPLPLTPRDIEQRYAIDRGSAFDKSEETGQSSRDNDTSRSEDDHDYDAVMDSRPVVSDDPDEHDYDAVTEISEASRGDLDDHRYSDVDDHGDHMYSATSTDSESNRDNVYEQIGFEPT